MQSERINSKDAASVAISRQSDMDEGIGITGSYEVNCFDKDGNLKWSQPIKNLVVTVGKNDLLDKYFAGSAYTAAWYIALVDGASTPTYAAGDTMSSHAGWSEAVPYSNATRPSVAWNAASAGSKVSTATSFTINATATVAGAFLTTDSTKSGTSGILYSAGSFTGGNRSIASGDTLNVTYTASV